MALWERRRGRPLGCKLGGLTSVFAHLGALIALTAAIGICGTHSSADSLYTSIRPEDCKSPPEEVRAPYAARDLGVQQCPAPDGWRLMLVSSDANTWLDLAGPGLIWSGERPIVYDSPIGNFPSVGGGASSSVEWRRKDGRLTALIVRVTAQNREALDRHRSILYVVRLQNDRACVIGRATTNAEARRLADSDTGCG